MAGESVVAGVGGNWPHYVHIQEQEKGECVQLNFFFLFSPGAQPTDWCRCLYSGGIFPLRLI